MAHSRSPRPARARGLLLQAGHLLAKEAPMARIEVARHVAADPSSLALLLSGPGGRDLWCDDALVLGAPQRSGLGFRVDLATRLPANARGRILISAGTDG